MPLYRVDTDQGDELGLRLSDEDPQPGEKVSDRSGPAPPAGGGGGDGGVGW